MKSQVSLFMVVILFLTSCMGISSGDRNRIVLTHNELSAGHLQLADEVTLVCMRNEIYSGALNDLVSWKNSQELFKRLAKDYLKINKIETVNAVNDKKLKSFFSDFKGQRLVLYFSSHLLSEGYLVFGNGERLSLEVFAEYLNSLEVPTLLIFDTCYAGKLKSLLNNPKVSVFYTGMEDELVYDLRIKGQKLSVDKKFHYLRKYLKVVYGMDERYFSLFSVLLFDALITGDKLKDLKEVFKRVVKENNKIRVFLEWGTTRK